MLSERRLLPSTACRITLEQVMTQASLQRRQALQVAHQSGFRLPYVPFVGLGIDSRPCTAQWSAPFPGIHLLRSGGPWCSGTIAKIRRLGERAVTFIESLVRLAFRSALRTFVDAMLDFPVKVR